MPGIRASALMAVAAMLSVQTGAAVSTWMFDSTGPVGAAWLRLTLAALVLFALSRPRVRGLSRPALAYAAGLGLTSAAMTMCYFGAIDRIPLGMASSLEYLGPFAVAVVGLSALRDVVWPVLAGAGVLAITRRGKPASIWRASLWASAPAHALARTSC
jgi:inner membrane transporter RhtA